jgi:hypothetical protein
MTERSTSESFILRVYRIDTEEPRKITGLLEAMDSSGEQESFTGMDELCAIVNRRVDRPRKRKGTKSGS